MSNGAQLTRAELQDLERIASISAGALLIDEVHDAVDHIVGRLIQNDGLILNLLDADKSSFTVVVRTGTAPTNRVPGQTYQLQGTVLESVIKSEAPIRAVAESSDEAVNKFPGLKGPYKTGYRSWLGVPLFAHGEIIGGLHIQRTQSVAFSDRDVDVLQRIAIHVGATTGKHQLISLREMEKKRDEVLVEIGKVLAQTNDVDQAVNETALALGSVMSVDRFVVSIWNPRTQSMIDLARWGMDIPVWDDLVNKPSRVLNRSHFDLNKTVLIVPSQNILKANKSDQPALAYGANAGLKSMMVAALVEESHRSGNISVRSTTPDAYSEADTRLFQEIAAQFTHYLGAQIAREAEQEAVRVREQAIADRKIASAQLKLQQSRDRIIDSISHELRTPLTVITARADILARKLGDQGENISASLEAIQRSSAELKSLINRLIDHADRTMAVSQADLIDLPLSFLEEALSIESTTRFAGHDIQLSRAAPEDSAIRCDLAQLVSASAELIDNAVKYGPDQSSVFVELRAEGSQAKILVKDAGTDLTIKSISSLLEPFERGDLIGNAKTRGSGLGLPYAAIVAEAHHGKVGFEKDIDGYNVFSLEIPLLAASNDLEISTH